MKHFFILPLLPLIIHAWSTSNWLSDDDFHPQVMSPQTSKSPSKGRLFFPPGSNLMLTPLLTIPIIPKDFAISTSWTTSLPVTINFDKLALKNWDDIKHWEWTLFDTHKNGLFRRKRSPGPVAISTTQCRKLSLQKLTLFKKLEDLIGSYYEKKSAKNCVLRIICEIHQFDVVQQFGIFGSVLREVVRADPTPTTKDCAGKDEMILEKYIKAQKNGERGSCREYHSSCEKSLFY